MPIAGDCKTNPVSGVAGDIYNAWTGDTDNGLASAATVSGGITRKLLGAQINAIAASIVNTGAPQPPKYSIIDHMNAEISRGATNPALSAGGNTVGQLFYLTTAAHIQGARFYWLGGGGALSVKCSIWKDTGTVGAVVMTRQEFATVSVNAAGIYTVTWTSGGSTGGSYALSGADLYKRWVVSIWETTNTKISQTSNAGWVNSPLPPAGYNNQNTPFPICPGAWVESCSHTGIGDSAPVSLASGSIALVEPTFTVD